MPTTPTTAAAIRDRLIAVIAALQPQVDSVLMFEKFDNELAADFRLWADSHPAGAHRKFQVRDVGVDQPPEVSNTDLEERLVTYEISIAYPQDNRWGGDNALDRDDVMGSDQHQIEHAVGMCGRANFTAPTYPDACWRSGKTIRLSGTACDFLVITQTMAFQRSYT